MKDRIIINEKDNVGVALISTDAIPAGHKFALRDIKAGEPVIKYGEIIGKATADISTGEWVHTHNVRSHLNEDFAYDYAPSFPDIEPRQTASFWGFRRTDGRAGIRNDIYIIPTVGCVNNICRQLEKEAQAFVENEPIGIFALPHQFGCSQLGEDHENIKKLLASIAQNPNASFVLFVGLGCENNGLEGIRALLPPSANDHMAFFNCQDVPDEIAYGLEILKDFSNRAKQLKRTEIPVSELCVGLKCGGSDGFSGLTANPLLGRFSDRLIAEGGSAILTEVPEMFGAEQLLMNQCENSDTFEKYRQMILAFKDFYTENGFPVYENPSPGNKEGGITTLEEKSLGCIKKAGTSKIVDVLDYGDLVQKQGLSVLNAPGNDLIAATALAASGCQIVLFTTGRGTPFSTFVPTFKVSSNHPLAHFKSNWIDFDASPMDEEALYQSVLAVCNGTASCKSEQFHDIAFFKKGVTL